MDMKCICCVCAIFCLISFRLTSTQRNVICSYLLEKLIHVPSLSLHSNNYLIFIRLCLIKYTMKSVRGNRNELDENSIIIIMSRFESFSSSLSFSPFLCTQGPTDSNVQIVRSRHIVAFITTLINNCCS